MAVVERLRCRSPNSIYSNQCYSIDIAGFTVAAPDILEEVVILGDGARGAPVGLAGAVLEPQLLNQRGFGFVQGKGEGTGELGKRLDAARQVGVQGTTTALPAVGSIVRHGGQVGVLAQQHIAQAVDHGKLGAAARLDRFGKAGKLRFHLLAVGAYLRGVAYGGTAAAHFLGGVLPQGAHIAGIGAAGICQRSHLGQGSGGLCVKAGGGIAPAAGGNVLRGAGAAHLPGVQRRAAGAVDAVAGSGFTDRKQSLDAGLPPAVNAQSAVVVLGAEGNFQRLGVQIHALILVKINRRFVHMGKALDGRHKAA